MSYAFWRKPNGTLSGGNDNKNAPTHLLNEIGVTATVVGDGISWRDFSSDFAEAAVVSSIGIVGGGTNELNEFDSRTLITTSLYDLIKQQGGGEPINADFFLKKLNLKAAEFFRKPKKKYVLVTSLSIDGFPDSPIEFEGCEIFPTDRHQFPHPKRLLNLESFLSPHLKSTKYQTIGISTEQSTDSQAFDAGMSILNFIVGLWTHSATYKSARISYSTTPTRQWITPIHLGPVHSLHNADGNPAGDLYWYQLDYTEDAPIFKPKNHWSELEADRQWACDNVAKSSMRDDLIRIFARYADALDKSNLDVTFLMLWGILEKITDTVGAKYDETIERAVWNYTDRNIARQLLNQVRVRRNRFVHSGVSTNEADRLCYMIKMFIDGHLRLLLHNSFSAKNFKEYGEFLSLPCDSGRLRRMLDWYQMAYEIKTEPNEDIVNWTI